MTVPIRIRRLLGQPRLTPITSEVRLSTRSLVATGHDHVRSRHSPCLCPVFVAPRVRLQTHHGAFRVATHHRAALRTTQSRMPAAESDTGLPQPTHSSDPGSLTGGHGKARCSFAGLGVMTTQGDRSF